VPRISRGWSRGGSRPRRHRAGALASLRKDPEGFVKELRLAAAIKWYELGDVSQSRGAEIAGVSRQELMSALGRYRVSPFQYTPEEALDETS